MFRIATDARDYPADDMTGTGAKRTGGRWNEPGIAVIYAAESRALACLETIVHLDAGGLPLNRYLVEIEIPDVVWSARRQFLPDTLPIGWDAQPASLTSIGVGTDWLRSGGTPILLVPSVVVPEEHTLLINPAHPDARMITARKVRRWLFDPRMAARP